MKIMRSLNRHGARVEICKDLAEASHQAAELFTATAREAVATHGRCSIALSGGSTPEALYSLLAAEPFLGSIPWTAMHFFWSDERCVSPGDPQSNYRMAREALLRHVPVPEDHIHRMRGEDDPAAAAVAYAELLTRFFGGTATRFDLLLLGMGDDGHTASLFPHSPALADSDHLVAAPFVEKFGTHRLTLTFRALNASARIMFIVCGAAKAPSLLKVFESGGDDADSLPAARVKPANGELVWIVDEAAAKLIPEN